MKHLTSVIVLMSVIFMLGGCTKYDLKVTRDPSLKDSPFTVSIVGVQDGAELAQYMEYPVGRWFAPDDAKRVDAKPFTKELYFASDREPAQILLHVDHADPIWNVWEQRGAKYLVVFVSLKGATTADATKCKLPMSARKFEDEPSLVQLTIGRGGIVIQPPPKPDRK